MAILAAILFFLLAFIVMVLMQYLMRENRIGRVRTIGGADGLLHAADAQFRETFQLLTRTTLHPGNELEILLNGDETYERLFDDLRSAKSVITFHVFWMRPGRLVDELCSVLRDRAHSGVSIFLLLDYFGASGVRQQLERELSETDVEIRVFRPLKIKLLYKVQHRMHIRAVVIDGKIGYTGGFGIDDRWLGDGLEGWRDTNVRVRGPVVDQLQAAFVDNWGETTGDLLVGRNLFHPGDERVGDVTCGILHTAPSLGSTNAERYFVLSISAARERLWITNPYFIPDDDFRGLLCEASRRGVDVRVLTPGCNNDQWVVLWASHGLYEQLLEAGIRIWEYRPSMIHAKTLIADGVWFSVGSINFDNRSVMLNDEVTLAGHDARVGSHLEQIFLRDLEHSDEILLEEFRKRGRIDRVRERLARSVDKLF